MTQLSAARRPLPDHVHEGFCKDDLAAGQVAEFQIRGRVLCDLLPEAGLELQEVVVDAGADDLEAVVHVGEGEEGFALDVGFGNVEGVEGWGVVVEGAEEVVVVAEGVAVGWVGGGGGVVGVSGVGRRGFGGLGDVGGALHGG